jgi:hypothetical protein
VLPAQSTFSQPQPFFSGWGAKSQRNKWNFQRFRKTLTTKTQRISFSKEAENEVGHWSLGIGHWSLVIGHWSLVIGHWALVISHWSLVISKEAEAEKRRKETGDGRQETGSQKLVWLFGI